MDHVKGGLAAAEGFRLTDQRGFLHRDRQVALGETWKSMASALKMKEKELKELNPEWSKVEPPVGTYVRTK